MTAPAPKPATPLPWEFRHGAGEFSLGGSMGDALHIKYDPRTTTTCLHQWDAAYIIHAANTLPKLEAEIDRLRERVRVLEEALRGEVFMRLKGLHGLRLEGEPKPINNIAALQSIYRALEAK